MPPPSLRDADAMRFSWPPPAGAHRGLLIWLGVHPQAPERVAEATRLRGRDELLRDEDEQCAAVTSITHISHIAGCVGKAGTWTQTRLCGGTAAASHQRSARLHVSLCARPPTCEGHGGRRREQTVLAGRAVSTPRPFGHRPLFLPLAALGLFVCV